MSDGLQQSCDIAFIVLIMNLLLHIIFETHVLMNLWSVFQGSIEYFGGKSTINLMVLTVCIYLSFISIVIQNWKIIEKMTFQTYPPRMKIKLF